LSSDPVTSTAGVETAMQKRRTFAIISHPDAGKTTITEKLLLHGNAIKLAGTVKGRKAERMATSDWMAMEQQRGISVTTSVMQFPFGDHIVNLLDTPGHEDFSEDTYRTLTAVDSALMVIDGSKGVEQRTVKLMEVCRLRDTPILTFVNKLDREIRDPVEVLDEIEEVLNIQCAPMNWPIDRGRQFKGVYDFANDQILCYEGGHGHHLHEFDIIEGLDSTAAREYLGTLYDEFVDEIELVRGASHQFDQAAYDAGKLTPVFFGTALSNFGIREMLSAFVECAPPPGARQTDEGAVAPDAEDFSGFVFKIQANMDPRHRDRIAFLRICSGRFEQGMKLHQVRTNKTVRIADAVTFMAGDRVAADTAYPGDIIGMHNHGSVQIGDTFTQGRRFKFSGIPNFAPEMFRRVRPKDPLKSKQLEKGLVQLSEEGASQVFRPLTRGELIVGAVGTLQFELVAFRLQDEYRADCHYEPVNLYSARWVICEDTKMLAEFRRKNEEHLALDGGNHLTYLAPTRANLQLVIERFPEIEFTATREH